MGSTTHKLRQGRLPARPAPDQRFPAAPAFHAAEPPKLLEATGAATLFNLATQNLLGAPLISSNCRFGKH